MKKYGAMSLIFACLLAQGAIPQKGGTDFAKQQAERKLRTNPADQIAEAKRLKTEKRAAAEREAEIIRNLDPETVRAYVSGKLTREQVVAGVRANPAPVKLAASAELAPISPVRRGITYGVVLGILVVAWVLNRWNKKQKGGK